MRAITGRAGAFTLACALALSCGQDQDKPPASSSAPAPPSVTLKAGDMAPDFSLPGSDGKVYELASYRGKQAVVLAWFAKAFTGG